MAKSKQQDLPIDEKLELALVQEEEQPYEIPPNWCWVKFGCLAMDMADGPFGSNLKSEHYTEKREVRIIQLSNIGEDGWRDENTKYTTFEHAKTISRSMVNPGEIVIAKMMPAGRAIKVPDEENEYILSSDAVKFVPKKMLNTDYLLYAINSSFFKNQVLSETQGITRARTSIGKLKTYSFALAPLEEQQRIVERIESLFEKLNNAKEMAQKALDTFTNRKAAILHKAFTGELTVKWREENGLGMDSWAVKTLGKMSELITKGASPRWQGVEYTDDKNQTLFITSENVREGYIDLSKEKYLNNKINEIQKRSVLEKGDVLLNIVGASIGRAAIYNIDKLANTNQAVCIIRLEEKVDNSFICYYLNSPMALRYYSINKVDVARANISLGDINALEVNIPSLSEQKAIVSILDNLFEKEEKAKELCDVIEKIDLMKRVILERTFRGKLGTNDSKEESALALLKKCLQ